MKRKLKVLNLYAGIGGNRKLWDNVEVTAVEHNKEIASIYKKFFPEDNVVVGDAHKYLLEHYKEFDFIWSSPPCPSHSRFNNLNNSIESKNTPYPDMKLYQEIIFLKHWFKGRWVVENVISYYEPLIKPQISGDHYFWSNFNIINVKSIYRDIRGFKTNNKWGFDLRDFKLTIKHRNIMLNNLIYPNLGLQVFECAFKKKQLSLFESI